MCLRYYVFLSNASFSHDFIKYENENRLIKLSEMFQLTYLPCMYSTQYSRSACFLDGRTSILVQMIIDVQL